MRICRKLLDRGADVDQIIEIDGPSNQGVALFAACVEEFGKYSEEDRLEMVQLLVEAGADPGRMLQLESRGESCNAIHCVVSYRKPCVLRCLLSSTKNMSNSE